jgi:hypothetical protein
MRRSDRPAGAAGGGGCGSQWSDGAAMSRGEGAGEGGERSRSLRSRFCQIRTRGGVLASRGREPTGRENDAAALVVLSRATLERARRAEGWGKVGVLDLRGRLCVPLSVPRGQTFVHQTGRRARARRPVLLPPRCRVILCGPETADLFPGSGAISTRRSPALRGVFRGPNVAGALDRGSARRAALPQTAEPFRETTAPAVPLEEFHA